MYTFSGSLTVRNSKMDKHWDGLGSAALTWEIETARQYPKPQMKAQRMSFCPRPLNPKPQTQGRGLGFKGFGVEGVRN